LRRIARGGVALSSTIYFQEGVI
jgi:hypothetical protein